MSEAIEKFAQLAAAGKSVSLDLNTKTGEQVARYSKNNHGNEGDGYPGEPYGNEWSRMLLCIKGEIRPLRY